MPHLLTTVSDWLYAAVFVVGLWVSGRVFRGSTEEVGPPRAWWRMSEFPMASFLVGALLLVGFVFSVIFAFSASDYSWMPAIIEGGVGGTLYLISFVFLMAAARSGAAHPGSAEKEAMPR